MTECCPPPLCAPKLLSQGFPYYFVSGTADENPGAGHLRYNDTDQIEATEIYISFTTANGADIANYLTSIGLVENPTLGQVFVLKADNSGKGQVFKVTAVELHDDYATLSVQVLEEMLGPDPLVYGDGVIFAFVQAGDRGQGGGAQGAQGFQGDTGAQGDVGAQGAQGSQGETGAQGDTGAQGVIGAQGAKGSQGSQGYQGFQGNQGNRGFQGFTGVQGAQGFTGNTGAQGSQGFQGLQGAKGSQGFQGFQGAAGTGAQGAQGSQGNQGAQGFQGVAGTGAQGSQGFQGDTGSQGLQGSIGAQGTQGPQGVQGNQGVQGSIGAQGTQGFQGQQGDTGEQGVQGDTGAQGFQGQMGSTGFPFQYNGVTAPIDPGSGKFTLDAGVSPSQVFVSTTDADSVNVHDWLMSFNASTNASKGNLFIRYPITPTGDFGVLSVTSVVDHTTWVEINVTPVFIYSAPPANAEIYDFSFAPSGNAGAQGAQGAQGTSGSSIAPNDPTNPTFVGSGQTPSDPGATANNLESCTATFSRNAIWFFVEVDTGEAVLCYASYITAVITAISDPSGIFLSSDAGVGIYISKSANSDTLTFKNRLGGSHEILVQAVNALITATTPWA